MAAFEYREQRTVNRARNAMCQFVLVTIPLGTPIDHIQPVLKT
jgi:hypothetical protein